MKKIVLTLFVLLMLTSTVVAQSYDYRYWIDNNLAGAATGSATGEKNFEVDISSLSSGIHALRLQAAKGSKWSSVHTHYFVKTGRAASSARYWFDNDLTTVHNDVATSGSINLNVSSLTSGLHAVHYQLLGSQGPSSVCTRYFLIYQAEPELSTVQIAIDNGDATDYTYNNSPIEIDIESLSLGTHQVHVTLLDSEDNVLEQVTQEFFVEGEIIIFADENVKALCVANWDITNDGELSEAEAAAVTDLGEVFKGNITITSFDELEYFTRLTSIGTEAFQGCTGLTSTIIPDNVTSIGGYAFSGCSGLTSMTVKRETPPSTTNDNPFNESNYQNAMLYVQAECVGAYKGATYWKDFGVIKGIPESITMATGSGSPRTMIGFSSANGLDFTNVSDVKAYIAVGFTASKDVLMARVNIVPPYTGVVLLTTEPGITVEVPTTVEDVYYANLLMPAVGSTLISPTETIDGVEYTNLLVGKLSGTQTMGFVQFSTPNYYTNKSYLHIPTSVFNQSSSAPVFDGLGMVFEDAETTDIRLMMQPEQETEVFYDLQGRKVTPTRKGLYIKNGKKVVIK